MASPPPYTNTPYIGIQIPQELPPSTLPSLEMRKRKTQRASPKTVAGQEVEYRPPHSQSQTRTVRLLGVTQWESKSFTCQNTLASIPQHQKKISALLGHRISASHCGHLQSWASGLRCSAQGQLLCDPLSLHTFTSGRNKNLSRLFLRIPQPLEVFFPPESQMELGFQL